MDVIDLGRYFGALLLVAALLGFAWLAARKYGGAGFPSIGGFMMPNTQRRLAVVETMMMGPRHKAYLLRRDGVEHLIVVGPEGTSVVENGITAPQTAQLADHAPMMAQESAA